MASGAEITTGRKRKYVRLCRGFVGRDQTRLRLGIDEKRHAGETRSGLLEQRQRFAGQVNAQHRKPGQVAAGMRQTCDKSEADRVRHNDKHDGNRACDLLQRNGTRRRYGDGDIDIAFDKLLGENRIASELLGGKPVQEFGVPVLDVTEIAKRLDEHREVLTLLFRAAGMPEHADSGDLPA
jgi:hypothetical protein